MIRIDLNTFKRWQICCLFLFSFSCRNVEYSTINHAEFQNIKYDATKWFNQIERSKSLIKSGDLVMRTGRDFTSTMIQQLCLSDKTFSHCGIAEVENDSVFVYHSIGGEWNPDEKLRRDSYELFCNPTENRGFGIFSFQLNEPEIKKLDSVVVSWYRKQLMFDMKFDLATDERLYCAEFVAKSISLATDRKISFATTSVRGFEYIAPDNLFLNFNCKEIARFRFQ